MLRAAHENGVLVGQFAHLPLDARQRGAIHAGVHIFADVGGAAERAQVGGKRTAARTQKLAGQGPHVQFLSGLNPRFAALLFPAPILAPALRHSPPDSCLLLSALDRHCLAGC